MKEIQYKSICRPIEEKAEGEDGKVHIKAYALVFGNVDSYGDIIAEGACDAFLSSEDADRMRLCYQHNTNEVIGVITAKGVDETGMWIEADILPTSTGKDVGTLIKGGAINEFSIGYYANEYHFEKRTGYDYELRILDAITIVEVSPVTRAANPQAVLIEAKAEQEQKDAPQVEEKPLNNDTEMEDMKKQLESLEQKAASFKERAEAAEQKAATMEENINNLDASIKAQQNEIESMRESMKEKKQESFATALKSALEENKDKIEKMFEEKRGGSSIRMDVKMTAGFGNAYGTQVDTMVGSAPHVTRAFLAAFGEEVVNGDKAAWLDGTFTNAADYVEELAAAADSDATAVEVTRSFGKIATRMLLSSELKDWMSEVYSWAQTEALEFINDKVDSEVWNGAGSSSAPRKVYGLKGQATAFAKVASYEDANVGDVIMDAVAQAKKNGFAANVAIVSFGTEAELKGLKDKNGNYIYNQLTGMFGQVRILPSAVVGEKEILVADSRCARVLRRPSIEVEITRDADLDGWKVNLRKSAQTKVKAAHKLGLIYVADKTAAITAISK